MSEPGGQVSPYPGQAVPGEVVSPSRVASAQDSLGHDFFNVFRRLIHAHTYHNEADQTADLATVARYEKQVAGGHFPSEEDAAPREDVSQRTPPPAGGAAIVPASAPQLDYEKLAAAIVAHQQANANPPVTE